MPVIKVWCLETTDEAELNRLHKAIVAAVIEVRELGLNDENDMTCLFPTDLMKYGLGQEIIVEILLYKREERTDEVLNRLAKNVAQAVMFCCEKAKKVECFVTDVSPTRGVWVEERPV